MTDETTASQPMQELVRDLYNFEGGRHFALRLEKMLASQPPVMVAEPVGDLWRLAESDGHEIRFNAPLATDTRKWIAYCAAPMVADPAGVALSKLCGKLLCLPQVDTGNGIYVSAIAMTGVISEFIRAATVKAVPSEALDAARYRFLRKGFGDMGPDVDLHNAFVDGDEKMDAAIDAAINSAAPLADKTGGGE